MPTLRHLIEELNKIDVDPDSIRVPARIYDEFVGQADDIIDDDDE